MDKGGDLFLLKKSEENVPNGEKNLEACRQCHLLLTQNQWSKRSWQTCPNNCMNDRTSEFSGIIAMLQPRGSWVAKWNQMSDYVPGIYAIHIKSDMEEDDQNENEDEDDEGFIEKDYGGNNIMRRGERPRLSHTRGATTTNPEK